MRPALAVLVVTTGVAHAGSSWSEYSTAQPLRPATQLVESACDLTVELRGAIAELQLQQRVSNPGPALLAAMTELELPHGAKLIGATVQRAGAKAQGAIAVAANAPTDRVTSSGVLGSDPLYVSALPARDDGRTRVRVIVQPIEPDQDVIVTTQWSAKAVIRDGTLQLVLPGRGEGASRCRGVLHVAPGPGASVERLRVDHAEVGARGTAAFELGTSDLALTAVLAFKRKEPVVWTQSQQLGERKQAQLVTVVTPPSRVKTGRALFVIDASRSMELVGRHNVKRLVEAITGVLSATTEIEAILFDRTPQRVLGGFKQATPEHVASIAAAIGNHPARAGSDLAAALRLARETLDGTTGRPMVIVLTDGVLGGVGSTALIEALGGSAKDRDLYTFSLAPGQMSAPDAEALRQAVVRYGGGDTEVAVARIDDAIAHLEQSLRPAWHKLELVGSDAVMPEQLASGTGVVLTSFVAGQPKLVGRGLDAPIAVRAAAAPTAPIAQLALAEPLPDAITPALAERLRARNPTVDDTTSFVALTTQGKVATSRRTVIAAGGPYTRMVDVADPRLASAPSIRAGFGARGGAALDATAIKLLFRTQLQPAVYACYQRALTRNAKLAGTATFRLELSRGELTHAAVTGLGEATFDACVLDAAYAITPPLPNPDYNTDDRLLVTYPLAFTVREDKPFVLPGDADSSTPLDIEAIPGGVPGRKRVKPVDTSTPLGNLRPAANP